MDFKENITKRAIQKEQTSNAILKASIFVFGKNGYKDASFTEISKNAGITKGLIVQRFGSKELLFTRLFNDILISNFPNLDKPSELDEGLTSIVYYVKNMSKESQNNSKFCLTALNSLEELPRECLKKLHAIFDGSRFCRILNAQIAQGNVIAENAFDTFLSFLIKCFDLTIDFCEKDLIFASNDIYLKLFKQLDALDEAKFGSNDENNVFEKILNNTFSQYRVNPWYVELYPDRNPGLFLSKHTHARLGIPQGTTPEMIYKYVFSHISNDDIKVINNALSRVLRGEAVEFEFNWSNASNGKFLGRAIAKRIANSGDVIRIEGLIQNTITFTTLRSHNRSRRTALKLFAKEYEYVGYVNLGPTADDDIVEDYKTSEFFESLVNGWEGKTTFSDRLNVILRKTFDKNAYKYEEFLNHDNRSIILKGLAKTDTVTRKIGIKHFGLLYKYEGTFFADRDDLGNLTGIICGFRLENSNKAPESLEEKTTSLKETDVYSLILNDVIALYYVNLKDHSFEILKRNDSVFSSLTIVPDFELYFNSYINSNVYFEDIGMMLRELTFKNVKLKLKSKDAIAIHYRDISSGTQLNYSLKIIRKDSDHVIVLIANVDDAYGLEKKIRLEREEIIHSQVLEIKNLSHMLRSLNTGIDDFVSGIEEAHGEDSSTRSQNIKKYTKLLVTQISNDNPALEISDEFISSISEASTLHDIGKLALPEGILNKKGKLTKEEFEIVKTHSEKGAELAKKLSICFTNDYYKMLRDITLYHHERWNGEGYPKGLKGNEIPLSAQIVGLVDVFDALVSESTYRPTYSPEKAYEMILNGECGSFNPLIISSFKLTYPKMKEALNSNSEVKETEIERIDLTFNPTASLLSINDQTLPILVHASEQIPCGFMIYKKDSLGTLITYNTLLCKYFKCESREDFKRLVNNSFRGIVHRDDHDYIMSKISTLRANSEENQSSLSFRIMCKDGEERFVRNYARLVHSDVHGDIFYSFLVDITDSEKLSNESRIDRNVFNQYKNYVSSQEEQIKLLSGTRILVVDENEMSLYMTKDTLENAGANVTDFGSGKEALDIIYKVKPFDLILTGLNMPKMNGVEFIKAIREWEIDKNIRVPIIAVTSEPTSNLAIECIEAGANGCMSKPISLTELARQLIISMKEHSRKIEEVLENTIRDSNTDILTHVKNARAYWTKIEKLNELIRENRDYQFGVVMLDINRLKQINDKYGHDVGDKYIRNCSKLICDIWNHSPVYRYGGDEFAVILENNDYRESAALMQKFYETIAITQEIEDVDSGRVCLAGGYALFDKNIDETVEDTVRRADKIMYQKKEEFQAAHPLEK